MSDYKIFIADKELEGVVHMDMDEVNRMLQPWVDAAEDAVMREYMPQAYTGRLSIQGKNLYVKLRRLIRGKEARFIQYAKRRKHRNRL